MINKNFKNIAVELEKERVALVAVSKTKPVEAILELYKEGQRIFGENRVQELAIKHEELPKDIDWHCIGHLQRNKVKQIAPFVSMIHSVDNENLLKEIDKQAEKFERKIPVLLQFHIAEEASKFGLNLEESKLLLSKKVDYPNVQFCGVMGMATFTDDLEKVRTEFKNLKSIFEDLKNSFFADDSDFKEISMGMSGDYKIAIEEGSTMVRIGSLIFGNR